MDETSDNGHFSHVVFNNVERFYVPGRDITCSYTLTQNIVPHKKDWVGIFQVGWKTIQEYCTFMWAPLPSEVCGDRAVQQQIQFKAYSHPKDDEYYQFCYVNQDDVVQGVSVPFQFRAETEEDDIVVVYTQEELGELELQNKNLLKENEELKASLEKRNTCLQEGLKKIQELQNSLESLRSNTKNLEVELNCLKREKKSLEELDNYKKAELNRLKEQLQNMTYDKECLETKLKTALAREDQLQEQNCALRKVLEEQKRSLQILQARKNEANEEIKKQREENDKLQKCFAEAREVFSSSISQPQSPIPTLEARGLVFGNPYSGLSVEMDRV